MDAGSLSLQELGRILLISALTILVRLSMWRSSVLMDLISKNRQLYSNRKMGYRQ